MEKQAHRGLSAVLSKEKINFFETEVIFRVFPWLINRSAYPRVCARIHATNSISLKSKGARSARPRASALCKKRTKEVHATKFYTDKPTWYVYPEKDERTIPRNKHATISVLKHRIGELPAVDSYLSDCEQRFRVEYLKRKPVHAEQTWGKIIKSTNAQFHPRGKNTVLECLQFGGNREFWDGFADGEAIRHYFAECYAYAISKIGFLKTHENILCAATVTEQVRRNLFVWYLPITETWTSKVMSGNKSERGHKLQQYDESGKPLYLSHTDIDFPRLSGSEFWKARGGLTSFSDLQEDFFDKVSRKYGAVRGESKSRLKNTNAEQAKRFSRSADDLFNEPPPFDDMPY